MHTQEAILQSGTGIYSNYSNDSDVLAVNTAEL